MSTEYVLPFVPSIGAYRFGTSIGRSFFIFDVQWNSRDNIDRHTGIAQGAWYFNLRDEQLKLIAGSLKIALGAYIGRRVNHPLFRQGVLVAQDTTNSKVNAGKEAGYDDLGTRVLVKYIPVAELIRRLSLAG
jgi:hypothetical protein